jgi:hypothetical protein
MGSAAGSISPAIRQQVLKQLLTFRVRHQRSQLLRQLFQCAGLWHGMAALFRRCRLGPVHERRLDIRSRFWLWLGIGVPLGMDAVPLRRMDLFAQQRMGVAARRLLGRMECPKDRPPAVEFRFATAPVKYRPRNDRREPWSGAGPTREIIQPAGNLQELGGTRNSARGYQELEPTIEHSPTAGICHGKSSHRALRDQLVAR